MSSTEKRQKRLVIRLFGSIKRAWIKFGDVMSFVMTHIILTFVFFLVLTPIGIIMKLVGRRPLSIELDKTAKTYWVARDKENSDLRPYSPF